MTRSGNGSSRALAVGLAGLLVGFLSCWEASSRWWLGRIPQPDDTTVGWSEYQAPKWPRVVSPLGGTAWVCSTRFCPGMWGDDVGPIATAFECDGFTCTSTMFYTYDASRRMWTVWTPLELHYVGK